MDGFAFDLVPADAIPPGAIDLLAGFAAPALLSIALVILILVAGLDTARSLRDADR